MAVKVYINGKRDEVEGPVTVTELLAAKKLRPQVVTVAVNRAMLAATAFDATMLSDDDEVEIMLHMAGGSDGR